MFMAVRLCLHCECRDSLMLSRYSFCQDDQNWSSLCWPFFRPERRRVMLSMGLKSRSSTSLTVVTNNAVELVTATKGLGVRTFVISPLTYSNGHDLITRLEFQLAYSEKLVVIKQGTANCLAHVPLD